MKWRPNTWLETKVWSRFQAEFLDIECSPGIIAGHFRSLTPEEVLLHMRSTPVPALLQNVLPVPPKHFLILWAYLNGGIRMFEKNEDIVVLLVSDENGVFSSLSFPQGDRWCYRNPSGYTRTWYQNTWVLHLISVHLHEGHTGDLLKHAAMNTPGTA